MSDMIQAVTPKVRSLLPTARAEAEQALRPSPGDMLAKGLSSCLVLVAPSGMDLEERRTWLIVAAKTLDGIPIDLLERGVRHARLVADHPSKIVPAIMADVKDEWQRRKFRLGRISSIEEAASRVPALPAPGQEVATSDEVAEIIAKHCPWARSTRSGAPTPVKSYEDYLSMGLTPEEARQCVEQAKKEGRMAA